MTQDFTKSDARSRAEKFWLAQSQSPSCDIAPANICQRSSDQLQQCGTNDLGEIAPCPWIIMRMVNNGIHSPKDLITIIDAYTLVITYGSKSYTIKKGITYA